MPSSAQVLLEHLEAVGVLNDQTPWYECWENRLGSPWVENVGGLLALYNDTVQAVTTARSTRQDILLRYAHDWRRAVLLIDVKASTRPRSASGFQLSQEAIDGLYAVTLAVAGDPYTALETDVTNLRDAAELLLEEVGKASLDDDVRLRLRKLVDDILWIVSHRAATGDRPLRDLATATTGEAATNSNLWQRILKSPPGQATVAVLIALGAASQYVNEVHDALETSQTVIEYVVNAGQRPALMAPAPYPALARAQPYELEASPSTDSKLDGTTNDTG